jgi:hypothetical protein
MTIPRLPLAPPDGPKHGRTLLVFFLSAVLPGCAACNDPGNIQKIKCGNGVCDPSEETCGNCVADCACTADKVCDGKACVPLCGNGVCDSASGENCGACAKDCACKSSEECSQNACRTRCGNGTCEAALSENCGSCAKDCGCISAIEECAQNACRLRCGNGTCDPGEGCAGCPNDCKCSAERECVKDVCQVRCGNGKCEPASGENCSTCAKDCACTATDECSQAACRARCGNGTCEAALSENCGTCAKDCGCTAEKECVREACQDRCGNGKCEAASGENCASCAKDCACATGTCKNGACDVPLCGATCSFSFARPDLKVNATEGTAGPTVATDSLGPPFVAYGQSSDLLVAMNSSGSSFLSAGKANSTASAYYFGAHHLVFGGVDALFALWDTTGSHVRFAAKKPGGGAFKPEVQVDSVTQNGKDGSLAFSGGTLFAAWTGLGSGGYDAYTSRSTDDGATWSTAVRLNQDATQDDQTAIAAAGSLVVVAWDTFPGDIFVARSIDGGKTFGAAVRVNDVSGKANAAHQPFVAVSVQRVHVVWSDSRNDSDGDVYIDTSLDGGQTFGADVQVNDVTTRYQEAPTVRISPVDGRVWVAWQDFRSNKSYDIYAAASADGKCFCKAARLHKDDAGDQMNPSFAVDAKGQLHAAYRDARTSTKFDIYYSAAVPSP